MKKFLTIAVCACLGIAAIFAIYRFGFRKSIPEAPVNEQVAAILTQNDCFVCHSKTPKLPFYTSFPIIGPMMDQHVTHAVDFIDLETKCADLENIDEVTLAMLDHAVSYGSMPIHQYKMIHWGTSFNRKEKSLLASWILEKRGTPEPVAIVPESVPFDAAKAAMGQRMFNDGRISLDGTISCASCHLVEQGGADVSNFRTSEGIYGQFGGVNAPTVYNSYFNIQQFWNGRAADLREQAAGPPVNPVEMGAQTWEQIVARLKEDKALVKEFEALYPGEGLTEYTVTSAIAEFEKTLITPGCRFDQYLAGDKKALTAEEIRGYEAFKKHACIDCHCGVILGGRSFEKMGIFKNYFVERDSDILYNADDDGLKGFTGKDEDLHKFKVPGLRNVALTAPYFHDGSEDELDDAVEKMAEFELGKELSERDEDAIVAFLKTLTGKHPFLK